MVMGNPKRFKIKPLTPFKFYGEEAPRKISKDPKQVLEPLLEWAQKAHWKQGGLAGHSSKQNPEDPLPQPTKLAREFFYDERMKQLEMRPTREEFVAMKPDLLRSWQALPLEERAKYEHLHQEDIERFEQEMEAYKVKHPEYESQINRKNLERKRAMDEKNLKKSKRLKRDVKVILTEDEASSEGSDDENIPDKGERLVQTMGTPPKKSRYSGAFEFPLSPRSIRRFKREAARDE